MTVQERLDAIIAAEIPFAWDECHKFYLLDDAEREAAAQKLGYKTFPASKLQEAWDESCFLRFINRWGLDHEGNDGFDHEFAIEQFEDEDED